MLFMARWRKPLGLLVWLALIVGLSWADYLGQPPHGKIEHSQKSQPAPNTEGDYPQPLISSPLQFSIGLRIGLATTGLPLEPLPWYSRPCSWASLPMPASKPREGNCALTSWLKLEN